MAEISYSHGMKNSMINELRQSANYYPLSYIFRTSAALAIGNSALNNNQDISELKIALEYDKSPELLALAIVVDLNRDNVVEAQNYFDTFKQVAKKSPLIGYIKQ